MQVGGNAKARAFFRANGGDTPDKNKKYSSRAAVLYKAKIHKLAEDAVRKYAGQVHIGNQAETVETPKKDRHEDFFAKFESESLTQEKAIPPPKQEQPALSSYKEEAPIVEAVTNGVDKLTVNLADQTITKTQGVKVSKVK